MSLNASVLLDRAVLPWQKPAVLYQPPEGRLSMAAAICAAVGMVAGRRYVFIRASPWAELGAWIKYIPIASQIPAINRA